MEMCTETELEKRGEQMIGCRCEHRVLEEVKKRKLRIIMTTGKRQGDSLVVRRK